MVYFLTLLLVYKEKMKRTKIDIKSATTPIAAVRIHNGQNLHLAVGDMNFVKEFNKAQKEMK